MNKERKTYTLFGTLSGIHFWGYYQNMFSEMIEKGNYTHFLEHYRNE